MPSSNAGVSVVEIILRILRRVTRKGDYIRFIILIACIFTIFSCATKVEMVERKNQTRIARVFSNFESEFKFNGSVLIYFNDKIIINKSYGYADEEFGIKNITETKFMIGSYTKQFTAAAIMLLDEEGKLSIEDSLNLYIPDFPIGRSIKIKHLLNHTSGLPREADYRFIINTIPESYVNENILPVITDEAILQDFFGKYELRKGVYVLKKTVSETEAFNLAYLLFSLGFDFDDKTDSITKGVLKTVKNFKLRRINPGINYRYSNLGYMILGLIIEKASGIRYEDFITSRIFYPLNMVRSGFNFDPANSTGFAQAWYQNENGKRHKITKRVNGYLWPGSAGMLYSTVNDINIWLNGISFILKETSIKKMYEGYVNSNVLDSKYGYGYFISRRKIKGTDRLSVWHDGRIYNYRSLVSVFPDDNLRVIILSNSLNNNSIYYWPYIIADILLNISENEEENEM
ncbi:MAG: hypothetical protein A2015_13545 [Spirochaetes bacterium GWF1_31_7]|nr:MAG: hypothetical protein A2Y30_11280 [Spirochaetes bacterium GWE1_32_154]OHD47931.1 MAG: hypothetical protein A2Y29_08100 [Spirochaetes bacterium GWE2_31_10]OHD49844.1 MAG: hypothetical protein A2015_13545 [Spirochaetes bacterium GWF1_31_7]